MTDKTYPTIILIANLYEHYDLQYVTATTGGGHATHSYHYLGQAVDFGAGVSNPAEVKAAGFTPQGARDDFAKWWYQESKYLTELIHTKAGGGGWYVKNGNRVPKGYYGTRTELAHKNHNHVAISTLKMAKALLTVRVQQLLHVTVDGVYGPKTVAAVKIFQAKHGLVHDGVVGPKTVAALRAAQGWKKV